MVDLSLRAVVVTVREVHTVRTAVHWSCTASCCEDGARMDAGVVADPPPLYHQARRQSPPQKAEQRAEQGAGLMLCACTHLSKSIHHCAHNHVALSGDVPGGAPNACSKLLKMQAKGMHACRLHTAVRACHHAWSAQGSPFLPALQPDVARLRLLQHTALGRNYAALMRDEARAQPQSP